MHSSPLRLGVRLALLLVSCLPLVSTAAGAQPGGRTSPGPLSRAHSTLEGEANCVKCHEPDNRVTPDRCLACHKPIAERVAKRVGVHRDSATGCEVCHAEHAGLDADLRPLDREAFDHAQETGFPLDGKHAPVARTCAACHKTRSFLTLTPACSGCHQDAHAGALGDACAACHSPRLAFQATPNRAFHKVTLFPLQGAHLTVSCATCHVKGQFKGTPARCYDCHWVRRQDDLYKTRLGSDCGSCHQPTAWTAVRWDHGVQTGMPLNAAHKALSCDSCHTNATFQGARPECVACHDDDFREARSPDHVSAGFPMQCDLCHRPSAPTFAGATFTHASFALVGQHAGQACASCHRTNVYQGTPRDCFGCHRADYERTATPNHAAAGFPTACETCHRATDAQWRGATFNHGQIFSLAGVHATQACASCHGSGQYRGTPRDCFGCHRTDYERTANPNHAAAGFPTACETCHRATDAAWRGAAFNHAQAFALRGAHATAACAACHGNGQYRGTPRDCFACHRADYERAANPNHASAGFSTACEACHESGGPRWEGASVNHAQFWPLVGLHNTAPCSSCHRTQFRGTPRDCLPCHQVQYQNAASPNHAVAAFPTSCDACHRTGGPGWQSTFNHAASFALVGVHAAQPCSACHRNGVYRGTSRECVGCHLAAYQNTRSPSHQATGFPTTCETCHRNSDTSWSQGRFTHTAFPITSGAHARRECRECHTDAGNFRVFSCTGCHDRARTDDHHRGRAGYRYDSIACYSCHPTGRGD